MPIINKISLFNYRNYTESTFEFNSKITQIIGNNGIGKTNLLDAIYYLAYTKSAFNSLDKYIIKKGEIHFFLNGHFNIKNEEAFVSCGIKNGKKIFSFGNQPYEKLSEHIGKIPVVLTSPFDIDLIRGHGEVRRKFIDGNISQTNPSYLQSLMKYKIVLNQRNALLKNAIESNISVDENLLQIYDKDLVKLGDEIVSVRISFCESFLESVQESYDLISGGQEKIKIVYLNSLKENTFEDQLKFNKQKDIVNGRTSVGPHKDDLLFLIKGTPINKYGSQGQQKTFILALRIAQHIYLTKQLKQTPIFLIDDLMDRLDADRIKKLTELLKSNLFEQVIITNTEDFDFTDSQSIKL